LRRAVFFIDLAGHLGAEIALERRNAARIGDVADIGRLDAEHAVAALLKIRQQRAVIGTDIDHEIVIAETEHGGALALQIREIVAQQFGSAAGVRIFRRKYNNGVDREAELHQVAIAAMQKVGRKPRLLARHRADGHHLVDRRHVAEREHGIERGRAANLAAFDWNAAAGASAARDFSGTQSGCLL
jgi:hypothetical protein